MVFEGKYLFSNKKLVLQPRTKVDKSYWECLVIAVSTMP